MKSYSKLKLVCLSAMLIAVEVVLNRFLSINTMGLKIGFSFVPIVIAAMLFGGVRAGIIYALADLIGALLFPIGPYFPGFTVSAFLMGLIYGLVPWFITMFGWTGILHVYFDVFSGAIQAYVFVMLTMVFTSQNFETEE